MLTIDNWIENSPNFKVWVASLKEMVNAHAILTKLTDDLSENYDDWNIESFWDLINENKTEEAYDFIKEFIERKAHEGYEKGLNKAVEIGEDVLEGK